VFQNTLSKKVCTALIAAGLFGISFFHGGTLSIIPFSRLGNLFVSIQPSGARVSKGYSLIFRQAVQDFVGEGSVVGFRVVDSGFGILTNLLVSPGIFGSDPSVLEEVSEMDLSGVNGYVLKRLLAAVAASDAIVTRMEERR
jgi:hypothetical protein